MATLTVLSPFLVRPAILQNNPNQPQPQPLICFVLPESPSIPQPFIPILVAATLPAQISQNYSLFDIFVFVEDDFVATFPLTDQPFFDEQSNSFVWLFFGTYEVSLEQTN
ncbi:MAG: hypothetical protein N3B10_15420, partial [Armatimonadetes bacterium]|nr:hypothetical protein [Armatimonadota bacterium]